MDDDGIKLTGEVEIWEGGEGAGRLIRKVQNAITSVGKNIVAALLGANMTPDSLVGENVDRWYSQLTLTLDIVPHLIVVSDGSTNHYWIPIVGYARTDNVVKYIAKLKTSEFVNQTINKVHLNTTKKFSKESFYYGGADVVMRPNTFLMAQNYFVTGVHSGLISAWKPYVGVENLEPTADVPTNYDCILYDDGSDWKIKFGRQPPPHGNLLCLYYWQDDRAAHPTAGNIFSTIDISANPIVKTSAFALTFVWKITVS